MNTATADLFWEIVADCLTAFHGLSNSAATRKARQFRKAMEKDLPAGASDMAYHEEPFFVAARIAGQDLSPCQHRRASR